MSARHDFFCSCPQGLESVLAEELGEIAQMSNSLQVLSQVPGGVHCQGRLEDAWLMNLHSRIASRVLLRVAHGTYHTESDLYDLAFSTQWQKWFTTERTIRIDVSAIKSPVKSTNFIALKIKDAVADRFRHHFGVRPSVDTKSPDIPVTAHLSGNSATLYLDTSGEPLFKRGWRSLTGEAPIRENLAAGILRMAGWKPGVTLYDPMCGSGTILAEAAQMLSGIAPGVNREFAFEKLNGFDPQKWASMKKTSAPLSLPAEPTLFGSDISIRSVEITRSNLESAGIRMEVPVRQMDAQKMLPPTDKPGILVTNPPYGERLGMRPNQNRTGDEAVALFYDTLGSTLKSHFAGWRIFLFTADRDVPRLLRLKESRKTPLYNGAIECRLFRFDMTAGSNRKKPST